jgi:hypothetical protein
LFDEVYNLDSVSSIGRRADGTVILNYSDNVSYSHKPVSDVQYNTILAYARNYFGHDHLTLDAAIQEPDAAQKKTIKLPLGLGQLEFEIHKTKDLASTRAEVDMKLQRITLYRSEQAQR